MNIKTKTETGYEFYMTHAGSAGRVKKIIDLYKSGETQKSIAEKIGVTPQRIQQILNRNSIGHTDSATFVANKAKAAKKEQERDLKCIIKHGCSYLGYKRIAKLKNRNGDTPQTCYRNQKNYARTGQIKWDIKFYSWWQAWQKSGKWEERGVRRGEYVMGRIDDNGPFSKDNIEIMTCSQNIVNHYL